MIAELIWGFICFIIIDCYLIYAYIFGSECKKTQVSIVYLLLICFVSIVEMIIVCKLYLLLTGR